MTTVRTFSLAIAVAVATLRSGPARADAPPPPRPNIIFVLADDLGLDGVSAYGADSHRTPNIDALAASGIRFRHRLRRPAVRPPRAAC